MISTWNSRRTSMKRTFAKMLFCIVASAMVVSQTSSGAWSEQKDPVKILYGHFDPPSSAFAPAVNKWAKELEEKTKGRIKVETSWGIGKTGEIYDLTTRGIIDVGFCVPSFSPGQFPVSDITGLPYIVPTAEVGSRALMEFARRGYLEKEFADVKVLHYNTTQADTLFTKSKLVTKVDELKGMKIFGGGPVQQRRIKLMGAIPVQVPFPDLYSSVQKGILDGYIMGWAVMDAFKLFEITRYATEPPSGTGTIAVVMNKNKWKQLPHSIQGIIDAMSEKYCIEYARAWDAACERGKQLFLNAGGQLVQWAPGELDRVSDLIMPVWNEWIAEREKKGLPAKKAVEDFYAILKDLGVENPGVGYSRGDR
ncbi:MAG: TRAP transporter substrate-binding protein [Thermodesulfobacteriota bacterium]